MRFVVSKNESERHDQSPRQQQALNSFNIVELEDWYHLKFPNLS